ncbi:MAG: helix-turn-helix domain-containing protein [Lactobacillales bacterium]|jgi:transcriptional regulator with XRE-family HTH domain|nr:helix-turn-helix domain-containing protein [Lactobacillales bacterium]
MGRNELTPFDFQIREQISNNLKKITYGKTQAQISQMTGIPISTLSGYFAKRSTINQVNAHKIAKAFNVHISEIDPRAVSLKQLNDWDSQLTPSHFDKVKRLESKPGWATDQDVLDLEEMLESNVSMAFGGEELTYDDKEKVKNVLTGIFWERLEKKKKKKEKEK